MGLHTHTHTHTPRYRRNFEASCNVAELESSGKICTMTCMICYVLSFKVSIPWAPKTIQNKSFGHLKTRLFTIKTSKNVGFGGSWYNPLTSGTSRTCHWLNRVVQSKRNVPRVVETYPPIQKERCLQNAMARFSQSPWEEQIYLPTNLLFTNSKHSSIFWLLVSYIDCICFVSALDFRFLKSEVQGPCFPFNTQYCFTVSWNVFGMKLPTHVTLRVLSPEEGESPKSKNTDFIISISIPSMGLVYLPTFGWSSPQM